MGVQDALTTQATHGDHMAIELANMIMSSVNKRKNLTCVISTHPEVAALQLIPGRELHKGARSETPFYP
jgi:hypothetical protein